MKKRKRKREREREREGRTNCIAVVAAMGRERPDRSEQTFIVKIYNIIFIEFSRQ